MTYGFSASVVQGWLDTTFGTTWVKLHTGDPGAAGSANVAAGDTTRKQATFAAATTAGTKALTGSVGPWTNGGTSETLAGLSLWTLVTGGAVNGTAALTASKTWAATDTFTLTSLNISITPIAV